MAKTALGTLLVLMTGGCTVDQFGQWLNLKFPACSLT